MSDAHINRFESLLLVTTNYYLGTLIFQKPKKKNKTNNVKLFLTTQLVGLAFFCSFIFFFNLQKICHCVTSALILDQLAWVYITCSVIMLWLPNIARFPLEKLKQKQTLTMYFFIHSLVIVSLLFDFYFIYPTFLYWPHVN